MLKCSLTRQTCLGNHSHYNSETTLGNILFTCLWTQQITPETPGRFKVEVQQNLSLLVCHGENQTSTFVQCLTTLSSSQHPFSVLKSTPQPHVEPSELRLFWKSHLCHQGSGTPRVLKMKLPQRHQCSSMADVCLTKWNQYCYKCHQSGNWKNRTRRWHPKALNTESTLTENKVAENKGIVQDTLIILKLGFLFLGFDVQMELRQNLTH